MSPSNTDPSYEWHEIERHTLTLRGVGDHDTPPSSITFVTNSVLSQPDSIHSPVAIAFDTTITLAPSPYEEQPVQHRQTYGDYSSILDQRSNLAELRAGGVSEVSLSMVGLDLRIFHHDQDARFGLCVEGMTSSVAEADWQTWPQQQRTVGDWLVNDNLSAYCLQFAFLTSLVDPPHLDQFISDIDTLASHLKLYSNSREEQ